MTSIFSTPRIACSQHADSGMLAWSQVPLASYPERIGEYLLYWAEKDPQRPFLVQRDEKGEWAGISYGEMFERSRRVGQFLLDAGCSVERPVAVLSENSIAHATIALGAMYAGIPVVPVSSAYSSIPEAFDRLVYCLGLVTPGALFVEDGARYEKVLSRLPQQYGICIAARNAVGAMRTLDEAAATQPGTVNAAYRASGPDTIVKILFTSGSTGSPKGVINTNRMVCANQQQLVQIYPCLEARPPRTLDWLPWSHTFGGNETFFMTLRHGGTLYIDAGKPTPALFAQTLRNLRDVQPTIYFNVPRGYDLLSLELERDEYLRKMFFGDLDMLFYSGSALPQAIWERLEHLSETIRGRRVPVVTAWGTTETAPLATGVHYVSGNASNVGVPVSGCEIKFAPSGGRYELRVRGPNVTPGYWRDPERTAAAFDDEGYYKTGDAGYLVDPEDPSAGIIFDGRIAEDFKLSTGTWVPVGKIRVGVVNALLPIAQDAVVLGQDWDFVGLLIFADHAGCSSVCGAEIAANGVGLLSDGKLVAHVRAMLTAFNAQHAGSSMQIRRAVLMNEPPSLQGHEITEKGYVNQRAVAERRKHLVEYLRNGGDAVIEIA
ncbi:MAG: feruloyl-CoA synthase [Burkholderia sp.]|nr:feruloyl-CoA synthase [Burkholderia sp.]